ncbi:MAG: GtrA family protein [Ilumatobacteraceae bacterium]
MNPSPALRRRLGQLIRYGMVSAIATTTSLSILTALVASGTMRPAPANVTGTLVGMIPSFELNRRWVWGGQGRPSVRRQVMPFVVLSVIGLLLSTAAVGAAGRYALTAAWTPETTAIAAAIANLAAFGTVWIAQFFILDRLLFRPEPVLITVSSGTVADQAVVGRRG